MADALAVVTADEAAVAEESASEPALPPEPVRPAVLSFSAPAVVGIPAVNAYRLRLVATRKLYDLGVGTQHSPNLAGLTSGTDLRLHPHDFDHLGIEPGAIVTVTAVTGSVTLTAFPDAGVPKGAAAVIINQPGAATGSLIDADALVTDVQVTSV